MWSSVRGAVPMSSRSERKRHDPPPDLLGGGCCRQPHRPEPHGSEHAINDDHTPGHDHTDVDYNDTEPEYVLVRRVDLDNLADALVYHYTARRLYDVARRLVDNAADDADRGTGDRLPRPTTNPG